VSNENSYGGAAKRNSTYDRKTWRARLKIIMLDLKQPSSVPRPCDHMLRGQNSKKAGQISRTLKNSVYNATLFSSIFNPRSLLSIELNQMHLLASAAATT
jgi:hypothetical protein